jgi:hypothetical protein
MTTQKRLNYRGYDILPKRQWESWCVSIYTTRADLPLLAQSTLQILRPNKQDAIDEAKKAIYRILEYVQAKVA